MPAMVGCNQGIHLYAGVIQGTDNDVTEERINADAYSYNAFRIGSNDGGQENISREHYV